MSEQSSFAEFGEDYQRKVVQLLIEDHTFAEQMSDLLNYKFFELNYLQDVVKQLYDFKQKYRTYPSVSVLSTIIKTSDEIDDLVKDQALNYFQAIQKVPMNGDARYIEESSLDFCKRQTLAAAMLEALNAIDKKNYESIQTIIKKAMVKGASKDLGYDYKRDLDKILADEFVEEKIPTGWAVLDKHINGGLVRGKLCTIIAYTGTGKCLQEGTHVLKFNGDSVPVEEIKENDLLMGPDSKPRKVLSTTNGFGPLYKITPIKGVPWVCNESHILTLQQTVTGEIIDIEIKDYLKSSASFKHLYKQFFTGVDFPKQESLPLDPYFLGVWFGDGTKDLSSVEITKPDKEIEELCEEIANNFGLNVAKNLNPSGCPTFRLSNLKNIGRKNSLLTLLRDMVGKEIKIPKQYLTSSKEDRAKFLAGFLDTDGHLSENSCYDIVQKREDYADAIVFISRSLGIRAIKTKKTIIEHGDYWRVSLSGDMTVLPMRIKRKISKERKQKKSVTRTGFDVEKIENGKFFGFTLDGDGRFLLGDFTVTHNSSSLVNVACGAAKAGFNVAFISMEEKEKEISKRIAAYYSLIAINDVSKNVEAVKKASEGLPGNIKVKFYPTKRASVETLRNYINRLKAMEDFTPDIVLVDYADLLKSSRGYESKRFELELVYEELRGLAQEMNICLFTADQTNRGGGDKEIINLSDIGEAFAKAQICDLILTLTRTRVDKQNKGGRLFIAKSRLGGDGMIFPILFDAPLVKMIIREPDLSDEIEEFKVKNENLNEYAKEAFKGYMNSKK